MKTTLNKVVNDKGFRKYTTHKAEAGDIITSPEFAFGEYGVFYDDDKHLRLDKYNISVDGHTRTLEVQYSNPEIPRGKPDELITIDIAAYDPSRGTAKFLVEEAYLGGGSGPCRHDPYPDGWNVKARRLSDDASYDPKGKLIDFYQSGSFTNKVREVTVVGKMEKIIEWRKK